MPTPIFLTSIFLALSLIVLPGPTAFAAPPKPDARPTSKPASRPAKLPAYLFHKKPSMSDTGWSTRKVNFSNRIELIGVWHDKPKGAKPGDTVQIKLLFHVLRPARTDKPWTMLLTGRTHGWARHQFSWRRAVAQGRYPLSAWKKDDYILDTFSFTIPTTHPPHPTFKLKFRLDLENKALPILVKQKSRNKRNKRPVQRFTYAHFLTFKINKDKTPLSARRLVSAAFHTRWHRGWKQVYTLLRKRHNAYKQQAFKLLHNSLKHPNPEFRLRAAYILAILKQNSPLLTTTLHQLAHKHPKARGRADSLLALFAQSKRKEHTHNLINTLLKTQRDRAPRVRITSLYLLGRVPASTSTVDAMRLGLQDNDSNVRSQAVRSLGYLGPRAIDALRDLLSLHKRSSTATRAEIIRTFGYIGPAAASAIPHLIAHLKKSPLLLRLVSARSLGQIGKRSMPTVYALIRAFKDPSPMVRAAAARALGNIGPYAKYALRPLKKLSQDARIFWLRKAAINAMVNIKKKPRPKRKPSSRPATRKKAKPTSKPATRKPATRKPTRRKNNIPDDPPPKAQKRKRPSVKPDLPPAKRER